MGLPATSVCLEYESIESNYSQGLLNNLNPQQENGLFYLLVLFSLLGVETLDCSPSHPATTLDGTTVTMRTPDTQRIVFQHLKICLCHRTGENSRTS